MAITDMAALQPALKEYYDDQKVENLAYDENPALAMVPKDTEAGGKYVPQPIIYETSQGRSSAFVNAQGNQSAGLLAEPLLPLRRDFGIATIDGLAMEASEGKKNSFLDGTTMAIDLALQGLANSAGSALFRTGTGSIGQISSITAGVIVLTNPADIAQFGLNQTLQFSTTDGGSPVAALGYVIARSVILGTVTVSATAQGGAAGSPVGWAAAGFLLVQGDSNSKLTGLAGWLPSVAPGVSDNFFGMNRSVDPRLYGINFPGQSMPVEEAIIDAVLLIAREKGSPKHLFINYGTYAALLKALGSRRTFVNMETQGGIQFEGLKLQGPKGAIEVYADRNCQAATGYLLQLPTWKLYSLGQVPKLATQGDGLEMLRVGNSDSYEARCKYYAQFGCRAPGWSGQVTFQV